MGYLRREYHIVVLGAGGVGKSCLTGALRPGLACRDRDGPVGGELCRDTLKKSD